MKHSAAPFALSVLACTLLLPACEPGSARAAGQPAARADEPRSVTHFGEKILLYLQHPPLVRGERARFLVHLSVLATGAPLRTGRVTLTIGAATLVAERPAHDGLFVPEGSLDESGSLAAKLAIAGGEVEETLDLGPIVVHASAEDARRAGEASAVDVPSGAVPFTLEQQWRSGLLLARSGPRKLARRLVVPATVRAPEGAEAAASAPVAGRLLPPESGRLPRSGDAVEAGAVLGFVEPLLGAADLAQIQALQLEFDLRALDVVRATNEAGARLEFAQRERERIAKLREHGLCTAQELDEAERNLVLARTDAEGARATREALERMQAARGERSGKATGFPVLSPLRGTVLAAPHVQGEVVGAGDEILRVLDTTRVWVEGRVSEFDLHHVGASASGVVTLTALPGARFETNAGAGGLQVLPTIDSASRTAVLRCELQSAGGSIKPGMLAELEIATAEVEAGVVVPADAVVLDQGLPTAYVMLEGELFQKRDLELGLRDGALVEVRRGIAAGERVATRGAYLVKLAALSPASFGAGHQH